VHDLTDVPQSSYEIFSTLKNNVPEIIVLNKSDAVSKSRVDDAIRFFEGKEYSRILVVSATEGKGIDELKSLMVDLLPEGQPFFSEDNLTDLPMRFFVAEIIREKIFMLLEDEITLSDNSVGAGICREEFFNQNKGRYYCTKGDPKSYRNRPSRANDTKDRHGFAAGNRIVYRAKGLPGIVCKSQAGLARH